jgi:hypothetical protein
MKKDWMNRFELSLSSKHFPEQLVYFVCKDE